MQQIVRNGSGDDYDYEPRFSNSSALCVFGPLICLDSQPRKSLSYNKLPQEPLRLTVLKLDGSSFGIAVAKTGTVGELKRAVEASFCHLPKKGTGSISWGHVWGQFCLCHEGQKLLTDSDYIGLYGIKDGDQLQFVRHMDNKYDLVKTESERGEEDSVDEHSISDGYGDELQDYEKDDSNHHIEMSRYKYNQDEVESDNSNDENRSQLGGWFSYRKLSSSSHTRIEDRSNTLRSSYNLLGSFKNIFHFYSNKYDSRRETWKGDS